MSTEQSRTDCIDQTNFVATEVSHVFRNTVTGKFYFCDESTNAHGPYDDQIACTSGLGDYVRTMNVDYANTQLISGKALLAALTSKLEDVSPNHPLRKMLEKVFQQMRQHLDHLYNHKIHPNESQKVVSNKSGAMLESIIDLVISNSKPMAPEEAVVAFANNYQSQQLLAADILGDNNLPAQEVLQLAMAKLSKATLSDGIARIQDWDAACTYILTRMIAPHCISQEHTELPPNEQTWVWKDQGAKELMDRVTRFVTM